MHVYEPYYYRNPDNVSRAGYVDSGHAFADLASAQAWLVHMLSLPGGPWPHLSAQDRQSYRWLDGIVGPTLMMVRGVSFDHVYGGIKKKEVQGTLPVVETPAPSTIEVRGSVLYCAPCGRPATLEQALALVSADDASLSNIKRLLGKAS